MPKMEELITRIKEALPDAELELDRPDKASGTWWLDARHDGNHVIVEYRPSRGFGVSSRPSGGYGDGADEFCASMEETANRTIHLLRTGEQTQPLTQIELRRLRESRNVSQEELARLMGVRQATVSKMERRSDLALSTLRRCIEALGGTLEVFARFDGNNVKLIIPQEDDMLTESS